MKLVFNANRPCALIKSIIEMIENGELDTWTIHIDSGMKYLKYTEERGEKE
jgi:hypothetical protein